MVDEAIRINCLVAGIIITVGVYVQMVKIFKTKSASDFTPLLVIALLYNEAAWMVYGLRISEWPIVVLCAINIPADIGIAVGYCLYGRRAKHGNQGLNHTGGT